jgi:flavin reductase (DIM6/NTAB) family NADH-FMN oxidoreductase RutF
LHRADREKDTLRNIKETRGFTVNMISEAWVEQANAASVDAPFGVSEWEISGLTKAESASTVLRTFVRDRDSEFF